jgi:uncharacterized cofD-like protein
VRGETNITASQRRITELRMAPWNAKAAPAALEAIETADLITIGPGSLFTSLVPNLLVRDVSAAIKNSQATKVYVCNLMTQANESLGLTASDHVRAVYDHAEARVFDYALINRTPASLELQSKYAFEGAAQIVADLEAIEALGVCPVLGDYLDEHELVARHATDRVARDLLALVSPSPAGRFSANPRPGQAPGN